MLLAVILYVVIFFTPATRASFTPSSQQPTPAVLGVATSERINDPPAPTSTPSTIVVPTTSPSPSPRKLTQKELDILFTQYSEQYKIDKEQLKRIARCESGLNPNAKNMQYGGLFQFSESSWRAYRKLMGKRTAAVLRFDPEASINTAAFMLSTGRSSAWPNCK